MSETWDGWEQNVYNHPEACGLELVGEVDDENAYYEFNTLIVVRDVADGRLYAAQDAGCSCPIPFEDVRSLADMTEIRSDADIRAFVAANDCSSWTLADKLTLYRKVREALARPRVEPAR